MQLTKTDGMGVSRGLLEALHLTEVKAAAEFERLTVLRAPASDDGSTLYALRKPSHTEQDSGKRLTLFGNTRVGRLQLSYICDRLGTRIDIREHHPLGLCIMLVLGGVMRFRPAHGQVVHTGRAGAVLICQLAPGAQALTADGTERLNLWLDAGNLHRGLETMLEQRVADPVVFAPVRDWAPGVAESLARLVRYVAAELSDPYSMFAGGLGVPEFEALVIRTLLEGVPHSHTDRLLAGRRGMPLNAVGRATAFMRENLARPLTVQEIATAAGCSRRALAAALQTQRRQSVVAYLRDLRLDAGRALLCSGTPARAVSEVAAGLQFSNAGRFASQYQARFGELPTETLRRRSCTGSANLFASFNPPSAMQSTP